MSTTLIASPLEFSLTLAGSPSVAVIETDPSLNTYFNCNWTDVDGEPELGWLKFGFTLEGELADTYFSASELPFAFGLSATYGVGQVVSASELAFAFGLGGDATTLEIQSAWVYWSDIGNLDFTIDRSNVAGKMPLDNAGFVYDLLKLQNSVIAYCANGIVQLVPRDIAWGQAPISRIGTAGRFAQTGDDKQHWFIDRNGVLWHMTNEGPSYLGYSEFFSVMTDPVISWDQDNDLLYVCDGTYGYVYSVKYSSLAKGPTNVSGVSSFGGSTFLYAPDTVTIPAGGFSTSLMDFGTRKEKTIFNLEIGCDLSSSVEAKISYRTHMDVVMVDTPTVQFTPRGIAYLPCYGIEFMFHLDVTTQEDFHLDWFKVNGVIHGFSFLDTVRKER